MMFRISITPQVNGAWWVLRVAAWLVTGGLFFSGCSKDHAGDCFKSTGSLVKERRELPAFRQIAAYDNVDVILVPDTQTYAEVRTGKNLQVDIELKVAGNLLTIHNTSRCNWVRRYDTPREVTLHTPRIHDLFLRGQGNISTAANFRADTLFCHLVGAGDYSLDITSHYLNLDMYELGDITLRGRADEAHLTVGGSGSLKAQALQTQQCYFRLNSLSDGDAFVFASENLAGIHGGTGTLYYSGNPQRTDIQITGKGKAVKVN